MKFMKSVTGVILAGGRSRRMGEDKALIPVGGVPVIQRIINVFEKIFTHIFIVSDRKGRYAHLGYEEIGDLIPEKGPLGGIYTALHYASTDFIFVTSCDMPFLSEKIIRYILEEGLTGSYDMVVPEIDGQLHPLCALYRKSCIPHLLENIRHNVLNLQKVIKEAGKLHVRIISKEELIPLDPVLKSFFNMNTREDLLKAQSMEKGG